jgi:hypothetical protein
LICAQERFEVTNANESSATDFERTELLGRGEGLNRAAADTNQARGFGEANGEFRRMFY